VSPYGGDDATIDACVVVLSEQCRPLRRSLRPLVWVILEEVALHTVLEEGRLVARTSARQVAKRLGIDPGTAASALAALRERGLVSSSREKGPSGRFGLSVYQLGPVAGLSVVRPCRAEPFRVLPPMVQPHMEEPAKDSPFQAAPHMESSHLEERAPGRPDGHVPAAGTSDFCAATNPYSVEAVHREDSPRRPDRSIASPVSSPQSCGQETLDLESGSW
jgi:DNA-binding transcriptional ArsR family regulator